MSKERICQKRLQGDLKLLQKDPWDNGDAMPEESNMLLWKFIIKGPQFSDYAGGIYIGEIRHHPDYPLKPPDFVMLTPSGRFNIGLKICLSNTGYHSDTWSSAWNIKSILVGFLSIMLDDATEAHGANHVRASSDERKKLAKESIEYNKKNYPDILRKFTRFYDKDLNYVFKDPDVEKKKENIKVEKNEPSNKESSDIDTMNIEQFDKEVAKTLNISHAEYVAIMKNKII